MPLAAGTRLGTYEIIGPLGAGGMGEVYRAKDLRLGREIALKVLPAELAANAERLARFEREARTVAALNHPSIVVLYSVDDADGVRFLTMELVEGETLDRHVVPGGLPVDRVLDLAISLAEALAAAHERGVIHRDLKPANVMLTRDGRVKVLDFGLAKRAETEFRLETSQAVTRAVSISTPGIIVGTVPYMAPEQLRGESSDARADLFSFGVVLYEVIAGSRPFHGSTAADISSAILRDTPEPLARKRSDLPEDLVRLVDRCLEKNASRRIQTAGELLHALNDLKQNGARSRIARVTESVASVAVLPFVNRGRDEEDEYFSDGLADELITMLAKIRGLRVAARSSAFYFKGKDVPIAEIGSALNVATVLDGSVRKAGNRVRISVQLVKVADGDHLWSETYDRTLEDIFAVQDDIAQSVVKELRTTLLGERPDARGSGEMKAEVAAAARGRSSDAEAQRLYLQARHLIDRRSREDVARGVEYLQQALARDPRFAIAWEALGGAYLTQENAGWIPMAEGRALAREAKERALSLEPDLAEAHAGMGMIQRSYDWDWHAAEASYARALELAPGNALVLRGAATMAMNMGRLDEWLDLTRRAVEQDPLSAGAYHNHGYALSAADRHAEAEAALRKALELTPQREATRWLLAAALLAQDRGDEALTVATREPGEFWRLLALAVIHHAAGHGPESNRALREMSEKNPDDWAAGVAEVHAARGETDAAFEWLGRAYVQRDAGLTGVTLNPRFRSLNGDPRWSAFLKRMGLPDRGNAG